MIDDLEPGCYRTRIGAGKRFVPVRVWIEDGDRGEYGELLSDQKYRAEWLLDNGWYQFDPLEEREGYRRLWFFKDVTEEEFEWLVLTPSREAESARRAVKKNKAWAGTIEPEAKTHLLKYFNPRRKLMTNIMAAFPSDYLKEADLAGQPLVLTMTGVKIEKVGDDTKPVVYFQGENRGLVLNKTNANSISDVHGAETDNWGGKQIELFPFTTEFQGRMVPCIRVRAVGTPAQAPMTDMTPGSSAPFPGDL